jgi:hypothetical protein
MNVHWHYTQLKVSYYTIFTPDPEEPAHKKSTSQTSAQFSKLKIVPDQMGVAIKIKRW